MLRALLRLVLIVVVLVGLGAFFVGYEWGDRDTVENDAIGTSGRADEVSPERARQTGAEVGEKVAEGANKAQRAMADASLTTKIKAKMTLDDTIEAFDIDVDSNGSTVTLSGTVETQAQRTRALQLARETDGVTSVVDRLRVSGQ
jgi:hyperosmotically inducible periplasmic protein